MATKQISPDPMSSGQNFGNLKAKPIKSTMDKSFTKRKAIPKRSMGISYKK